VCFSPSNSLAALATCYPCWRKTLFSPCPPPRAPLAGCSNKALAALVPNPVATPPVVSAQISGEGKFAFVELRTEDLASAAMFLDKFELFGRSMNVGRPRGYVQPGMGGGGGGGGW